MPSGAYPDNEGSTHNFVLIDAADGIGRSRCVRCPAGLTPVAYGNRTSQLCNKEAIGQGVGGLNGDSFAFLIPVDSWKQLIDLAVWMTILYEEIAVHVHSCLRRSSFRETLPEAVIGKSATNSIALGTL